MQYERIDADFLIIGGGSAGCMAAIRALESNPKLKVVIFEKSDLKYGGSIARGMDALNIVAIPGKATPEMYVDAITESSLGVCDYGPSYVMAARSFELLKKLESWGVYFPKDEKGQFKTLKYHVKGEFQACMEEPNLKVMIAQRATELGAKTYNRTMVTRLLKDGDRIAGAIGFNTRSGRVVVCRSKTVLLSNGGTARYSLPASDYHYGLFDFPGNTGDGYIAGFDAGAGLTGMEYTRSSILIKDASMPLLAVTVTRGGRVLDIFDNILMENEVCRRSSMQDVFAKGNYPLRIRLSHLKEETIKEIENVLFSTERPVQERFFKGRRVDFRKQDIELWPTECQLCGGHGLSGFRINEKAETCVPGLYAAGDVASVPQQHLSGAFVFGEIAGEQAVEFAAAHDQPAFDADAVESFLAEHERRSKMDGEIALPELEHKARRLITDYTISPKNHLKLTRWLEWSEILKDELRGNVMVRNGHDLALMYEVENIIRSADLSATAARFREESRWGSAHKRFDFPERDDVNWKCHVVLKKGADDAIVPSKVRVQNTMQEEVVL